MKTNLTLDQLDYALNRKYIGLVGGKNYLLESSIESKEIKRGKDKGKFKARLLNDARIILWKVDGVKQPSVEDIHGIWEKVKEDFEFLNKCKTEGIPEVLEVDL